MTINDLAVLSPIGWKGDGYEFSDDSDFDEDGARKSEGEETDKEGLDEEADDLEDGDLEETEEE